MKQYGKYEKRAAVPAAKQKKTTNVLLQTYFSSLLCLVLCVTMFLGTSYAWFTSEVSNTANEIYVGTLKVGLYKQSGEEKRDLADANNKLFDGSIRWEPGYTALETVEVVNKGDLAFNYVMNFTDGSVAEGTDLASVAQYFDVWVFDHYGKTYSKPASYSEITAAGSNWEKVGTLANVLAGAPVFDGVMQTVRKAGEATVNEGTTDGVATTDTYTIALHMNESADSAVMGKKITLSVKLIAYQMASEKDAFATNQYDDLTAISDAEEFEKALRNGEDILLTADIKLEGKSFTDKVSCTNTSAHAHFVRCTFSGGLKPYGNTTLENCTLSDLDVSALQAGKTVTLINCIYADTLINGRVVLTSDGDAVMVTEGTALTVTEENMVVLAGTGG